jgi:glycosyltransferase involved in cell wall biosynthesis
VSGLRVSVVIPAYKAARTIGAALDSVLAQTRPADEVIVIDDGSPDDTEAVVAPYLGRVRYLRKENGGVASARNLGLEETSGELVALLDADDWWEPAKLERQLAILTAHPEVGLVAGRAIVRDSDGQNPRMIASADRHYYDRVLRPTGHRVIDVARRVWTGMLVFRRSILGEMRFDTTLRTAQDVDMWIRLVAAAPTWLIWEPLANYVLTPQSLSRSNLVNDCRNMLRVLDRYRGLLGPWHLRGWQAEIYKDWAAGHLWEGDARRALSPAWARLLRQPWSPQAWWIVAKAVTLAVRGPRTVAGPPAAPVPTARVG